MTGFSSQVRRRRPIRSVRLMAPINQGIELSIRCVIPFPRGCYRNEKKFRTFMVIIDLNRVVLGNRRERMRIVRFL